MTVAELIELLKEVPQDYKVVDGLAMRDLDVGDFIVLDDSRVVCL